MPPGIILLMGRPLWSFYLSPFTSPLSGSGGCSPHWDKCGRAYSALSCSLSFSGGWFFSR